jgi:hypothetical protein
MLVLGYLPFMNARLVIEKNKRSMIPKNARSRKGRKKSIANAYARAGP